MALSRSIITQAIHHQPPIKAKYNNYFVLRGRAPPRYVSSVHVRTVSNFDGKFLLHRRRYTNAALKNAGKKLMCHALIICVSEGVLSELLCIHIVDMGSFDLNGLILCVSEDILSELL